MTVIGTLISERYRLEEKIGSGGMSSVYRAFDPMLERWVAIKLMHRDISNDPDQLERFRREARAVAQLNHPHVVTVIDAGEDDGAPYIVFEYVEGETLKERIRRLGRLPVAEAVAYAIEIGRALECAHENKLVHRDVKPQNVLIDRDGRAKVTDFGIARSLEAQGLTATGRVLGTTDYVSPEQALGHEVTEPVRHLLARDRALRDAHRRDALPGGHAGGGGDEARARAAAGRPAPPAGDLRGARRRGGARDARRRRRTATRRSSRDGARPRGGAGDRGGAQRARPPARPRPCCGRCPATPRTSCPIRLRHPKRALALTVLVLALLAAAVVFLATRTEKGTGGTVVKKPPELSEVQLAAARRTTTTRRATARSRRGRHPLRHRRQPQHPLGHRDLRGRLRRQQRQAGRGHLRGRRQADRRPRSRRS